MASSSVDTPFPTADETNALLNRTPRLYYRWLFVKWLVEHGRITDALPGSNTQVEEGV